MWVILVGCARTDEPVDPPATTAATGDSAAPGPHTGAPPPPACEWDGSSPLAPTADCPVWRLAGDVAVDDLAIGPGTVLAAAPGAVLTVRRTLDALGTVDAPIVLGSDGAGPWGGLALRFAPEPETATDGPPAGGVFTLQHVEVRDAGAGTAAAITIDGGYVPCGSRACAGWSPAQLVARDLTVAGSASAGIAGDGRVNPDRDPVGFRDVTSWLVEAEGHSLGERVARDLGGNALPAIRLRTRHPFHSLTDQGLPVHALEDVELGVGEDADGPYGVQALWWRATVAFGPGVSLRLNGGGLDARHVTFTALDPASPWGGLRWVGEPRGQVSALELQDCRVEHTASPALDWAAGTAPPAVRGTVITAVDAPPGEDVCAATCVDLADPSLRNTLDCAIPLRCP